MSTPGDASRNSIQEAVAQAQEAAQLPSLFVGAMYGPDLSVSGDEGWNMRDLPDDPAAMQAQGLMAATLLGFVQAHCEQMLYEKRREFGDEFDRIVEKERLGFLNQWDLTVPSRS